MSKLKGKIDFVLLISATNANPNGDPLNGNRPRENFDGYGEISDVCIKRKIRNRLQDMGQKIFVQSDDRADDGYGSLRERAEGCESLKTEMKQGKKANKERCAQIACQEWMDVRSFGQVFAFKSKDDKGVSVGVRGPVSIHQAVSVSPVEVHSMQITKSVNGDPSEQRSSDTMGTKHMVRFGLYLVKGSINVQLAEKTGFSQEDADMIKKCLCTLFENDASAARPDGSMSVYRLYWWQHEGKTGKYSSAKVHHSVKVSLKDGVAFPTCVEDYVIACEELPGLTPEIIDGI